MSLRKPIITSLIFLAAVEFFVDKFDLYTRVPHMDKYFHVTGGILIGWIFAEFFKDTFKPGKYWYYVLAVSASVMLVGVFWEYAERLSSIYSPVWFKHYFYGGNLTDTLWDLLADFAGALVVVLGFNQKTS